MTEEKKTLESEVKEVFGGMYSDLKKQIVDNLYEKELSLLDKMDEVWKPAVDNMNLKQMKATIEVMTFMSKLLEFKSENDDEKPL